MSIIEKIKQAGIVGGGGAGFPTHIKLAGNAPHLIVNAMECEPLLRTDRYIMRHFAPQLVEALVAIAADTGAKKCTFALKENYKAEIAALQAAIADAHADIALHTVSSFYPAGDEQVVVYEVVGHTVPPLNIPISAGCVVINVSTLLSCHDALAGKPLTHRYLTVTGAVKKPCIVYAPIGMPFAACIALAGGVDGALEDMCIVSGGPMMGARFPSEELGGLYVQKTTSGILVLPKAQYINKPLELARVRKSAKAACIQCSYCTEMCPRHLLGHPLEPHRIMRKLAYGRLEDQLDDPVVRSAALCCECGVCEIYACPMQLMPRRVNALIKKELAKAGIRYPKSEEETQPHPMRESRKTPSRRAAARAGVGAYYAYDIDTLCTANPSKLCIPLSQGVGAAAEPLVAPGDIVRAGQRIAACPEGRLGADLFAPMAGRVSEVNDCISIER